jgi:hypothetical protein
MLAAAVVVVVVGLERAAPRMRILEVEVAHTNKYVAEV